MKGIINIAEHNCSDCYRCVKACNIKAISVRANEAKICESECTRCGECLEVCPHDMIELRDDVEYVKRLIKRNERVAVSLHWSWNSEFAGIEDFRMVEALKLLGFTNVSEMLLGSEYYEECLVQKLYNEPKSYFGIECPVVVRLVTMHYPHLVENLPPIAHPAVLHGRMLRQWFGADCRVVHITPCVAMKPQDADEGEIDAVLTFSELRQWMWDEGVEFDFIPGNENYHFEPYKATHRRGVVVENMFNRIILSGFKRTTKTLEQAALLPERMVTELWSCSGGCLESTGATDGVPLVIKELEQRIRKYDNHGGYSLPRVSERGDYAVLEMVSSKVAESQIEQALQNIGKFRPSDYYNCSACGYDSCRDFALAIVKGKAEQEMCVSYSRNLAQKKFTTLLSKMPSGVMLADHNLRIIEANSKIADILGAEAQLIFGANQGMRGADLEKLITFTPLISGCLAWNKDVTDEQVQIGEQIYRVSAFSVEPHRVVCVVVNQAKNSGYISEQAATMAREAIAENLEAVQKIAHLLGETASRTEAVINSIIKW